ncbi:MAG: hypothetical protein AB7P50_22135 [Alphaproteobacteria bacterium]
MSETIPPTVWKRRRKIIFGTLWFCAAAIAYLTVWGKDTALHSNIALGAFGLAGMVIGAYCFGAVWDDKNYMDAVVRLKGDGK